MFTKHDGIAQWRKRNCSAILTYLPNLEKEFIETSQKNQGKTKQRKKMASHSVAPPRRDVPVKEPIPL